MLFAVLIFSLVASSHSLVCDSPSYFYKSPGDVMLSAIIGAHLGEDCSTVSPDGLQLIQAIIKSVEAVKINNLIPGLTLGLSVYDSCSRGDMAQKSIISSLVDAECNEVFVLGILIESTLQAYVRNLTTSIGVMTFTLSREVSASLRAEMIASTLYDLHWSPIHKLITMNGDLSHELLKAASSRGICVQQLLPLTDIHKIEASSNTVILLDSTYIKQQESNTITLSFGGNVLLVPLEERILELTDFSKQYSKLLVMLPATLDSPDIPNPFNVTEKKIYFNFHALINAKSRANLLQVQIANDIMKIVGVLKRHLKLHCQSEISWSLCSNLPKLPYKNLSSTIMDSLDLIKTNLKFLGIAVEDFESSVLFEQNLEFQRIGAVKISKQGFTLDAEINITDEIKLCRSKPTNDSDGLDCSDCTNFNILYKEYLERRLNLFTLLELKQDAWVAALLSISSVGVLCCIAVAIFIVVRICNKDMLEGNPGFSFLLLLSIVCMYCSILPYSFEIIDEHHYYRGVFCGLKIFGTSLSYSLVFSIMLARSFMLASCDEDGGFMSHINGYLQTVLCFFIAAVQVALTLQFWAINWLLLSQEQCVAMSKGTLFLFLLAYDLLLLLLLISVSPFVLRSKRNYHEGCFFAVSSYICFGVWIAWCIGYILLPEWADVCVCSGLVATATVILVSVFIPRTYLMLTGIVRDHIVSTLPSLNHTTSTSILDMNYRSTQALYDSVTLPRGSNYYAERPTTPSTSKMEDEREDNTYERYERSPSPRNITRF